MNPIKLLRTIIPVFVFLSILAFFFYSAPKPALAACNVPPQGTANPGQDFVVMVEHDIPGDYTLSAYAGTDTSKPPIHSETKNVGINPLSFTIPGDKMTDALLSTGFTIVVYPPGAFLSCTPGPVFINVARPIPGAGQNPCPGGICNTPFGPISSDPGEFVGRILEIGLGVAGGIAFILMVIGSIRVLTSSGDPQRVAGGRDMIVAAVAGLLFLIFSVLILRFIGVEILNLPFT